VLGERVISWFSCGAASAVASKLAIQEYDAVEVIYQETHSEHPDNERFLVDCEQWFKQPIIRLASDRYHDIWDVFERRRYLSGTNGALCTSELKRMVAEKYIRHGIDLEIFGYTVEERDRVIRFCKNNPERRIRAVLLERGLTKEDCLGIVNKANIEIPVMYRLGYNHNNCIGCVKAGFGYWNKIRVDFPDTFDRMARLERKLNMAICKSDRKGDKSKPVFLDELDPNRGHHPTEPKISCGIMCESEFVE